MRHRPLRAVLFDLDGTLVDNMRFHIEAWIETARSLGREITAETVMRDFAGRRNEEILPVIVGRAMEPAEVAALASVKEARYRELFDAHVAPIAGAVALLDELDACGVVCGIASAAPKVNRDFVLDRLGLRDRFRVIVGAEEVSRGKPAPDLFLLGAERLGVDPAAVLVFEDAHLGVVAARAAGMRACGVTTTEPAAVLLDAGAMATAPDLAALPDAVRALWRPAGDGPSVSLCMIVKDEEPNIARALASVEGVARERIVVDTGSRDGTVAVARAHGATVSHFAWTGDFAAARNHALSLATGDWVLTLDADEALGEGFRARWRDVLGGTRADGLTLPVANVDADGALQQRVYLVRLHRNDARHRFVGRLHEEVASSIAAHGGTIEAADLPLVHHGYTRDESARKDRRGRNRAILQAAIEAEPANPRHWHYLGLELLLAEDLDGARALFERVLRERPDERLAGWSASLLTGILVRQRENGLAWEAATFGARAQTGQIMSLVRLGELAAAEGDPLVADACGSALAAMPAGVDGDVGRRPAIATGLRAAGLWERGLRAEAIAAVGASLAAHPDDGLVADQLVRWSERVHGPMKGAVEALRAHSTAAVASAVAGAFVRQRAWAEALDVARRWGVTNAYVAHALLRAGRVDEAARAFEGQGEAGAQHLALWAATRGEACDLAGLDANARALAEAVRAGAAAPAGLRWMLLDHAARWMTFGEDDVVRRLVSSFPATAEVRAGLLASLFYDDGRSQDALAVALEAPDDARAQAVIGAFAYERGDMEAAAHFLGARAARGDAPVRVYVGAAEALRRRGRADEAASVLAAGRRARPHSLLIQSA